MMANFVCQFGWATGCPGIWLTFLSMSVMKLLEGVDIWIHGLNKEDSLSQCERAPSKLRRNKGKGRAEAAEAAEAGVSFWLTVWPTMSILSCLLHFRFSSLQMLTGTSSVWGRVYMCVYTYICTLFHTRTFTRQATPTAHLHTYISMLVTISYWVCFSGKF